MALPLKKRHYGVQGTKEKIDWEFSEFTPTENSIKQFFQLYETNFYSIENSVHDDFIARSQNYIYPPDWMHPLREELNNLKAQEEQIKEQIDSIEGNHSYFKNGKFITNIIYQGTPTTAITQNKVFYMQSGHKRKIMDQSIYYQLKTKARKRLDMGEEGLISDDKFLIYINASGLSGIPTGPDITTNSDIYIPTLEINRYNPNPNRDNI